MAAQTSYRSVTRPRRARMPLTAPMRSLVMVVLAVGATVTVAVAQVDEYIMNAMEQHDIPGLALAVVRNGELVQADAYGLANVELDVPVTVESVFPIASVTKPFTATAIMMLVEEGKVDIDEPIGTYLIDAPGAWRDVTVRHLLSHTVAMRPSTRERNTGADYTTAEMYEGIAKWDLVFPPGERWQYFDLGYFLLGMILERQSGQRYRDFLQERMFDPLGMTKTTVIDQWKIVKDRVAGYTIRNGKLAHIRRNTQIELPSYFGILSTVVDLAKWKVALDEGAFVSRATLDAMWSPVLLNDGSTYPFGLGWLLMDHRGHRRVLHSGGTGTNLTSFPDDDLTIVILTNLGHVPDFAWHLALGVAGHYDPDLRPPDMLPEQPDPAPGRTQRLKDFLIAVAGRREPDNITTELRAVLPTQGRFQVQRFREVQSLGYLVCDDVADRRVERLGVMVQSVCHYKVVTPSQALFVTFWLTEDGRVADFMPFRDFVGDGARW